MPLKWLGSGSENETQVTSHGFSSLSTTTAIGSPVKHKGPPTKRRQCGHRMLGMLHYYYIAFMLFVMSNTPSFEDVINPELTPNVRRRLRLPLVVIVALTVFAAGLVTGVLSRDDDTAFSLEWSKGADDVEEATLTVPVDHADTDGPTMDLQVTRRVATDPDKRIGSLIVNPGGPGFGASMMVTQASMIFQEELLASFDIVALDPRGTGKSTPAIDCIDDYDQLTINSDPTPADEQARQAQRDEYKALVESCIERTGDAISHMTTAATARDIDLLRQALGENTISYFGTSYGCELGATWATLFPSTVRAAVLDGCADPTADTLDSLRQQAGGFQASLENFMAMCVSVGPQCPIPHNGDPADALRTLWDRVAREPIPGIAGRPDVNESTLQTALIAAMYTEDLWPTLAEAITTALSGDGSLLTELADSYNQRRPDGTWGNELEAFSVITCLDARNTPTDAEYEAIAKELSTTAPLLYPDGVFITSQCPYLPAAGESPVTITGASATVMLVIGNTGDPATPFASTERMAAALESAVLVAVESNNHGGYGINDCINEAVHRYLIDGTAPQEGTRC
ncbi:MAG: alpha/beta fold hydrolase [Actinobacteria bacterium]|nr:alpha/beta fold hydrolase [Actinomycetota bacterium]